MANSSAANVGCPPPFLYLDNYPYLGGQQDGRMCVPSPISSAICCLPCPLTDWVYPDNFNTVSYVSSWVGVGSLICCGFLLLSFVALPARTTSRHYLTICLIAAIFFLELAFVIPLGTKPDQCFDRITPNNLHSDISCALSGIFLVGGGFGAVIWVFIRSLSVHLQICWKIVPGSTFFYLAQFGGWGLTALFVALALSLSGVSYRLGNTCHINHVNSIGTFWGPLLAFAALSLLLQFATFGYCVRVYLQVVNGPKGLPSTNAASTVYTNASGSNQSAVVKRATYRRVRKVVALQWRGISVVMIVIVSACYLATVFLLLDADVSKVDQERSVLMPWILCILEHKGDKNQCLDFTSPFILNERIVLPVLYLISTIGFWALFFLGKWDMLAGWRDFVVKPFHKVNPSRNSSMSMRPQSEESFSTKMRATPQHLHIIKSERGLSVANKAIDNTNNIELMRAPPSSRISDPSNHSHMTKDLESAYNSSSQGTNSQRYSNAAVYAHPLSGFSAEDPTSPERVWPGPRSSLNFSRPAPQRYATAPTVGHYGQQQQQQQQQYQLNGMRSPASIPLPMSPPAFMPFDTERSDSTASHGGWYMQNPVDEEEDTVPLSPMLPPMPSTVLPAPPPRARGRAESRASSVYSFTAGGGHRQNTTPVSDVGGAGGARPSASMAWDPYSAYTSPSPSLAPYPEGRKHYPSRSTSSSPALGVPGMPSGRR